VISMGVFTTGADLRIRTWDAWLAEVTGITAEAAYGQHVSQIIPDLAERRLLARFERVVTEGVVEVLAPTFHQFLIPTPPRAPSRRFSQMQQSVTIAPLRSDSDIVGVIVKIEDVTARIDRERDLAEQLASPDEKVRLQAVRALSMEWDDPLYSSGEPLLGAIGDASWRVRRAAVDSLANRNNSQMVSDLLQALRQEHHNLSVLNSALQVLTLTELDVVVPLMDCLLDPDKDLRIYAALALGDQQDSRAVPALIKAMADEDVNVRYHAIDALGRLRAAEAVPHLVQIAEIENFFLAFPALDALRAIGDRTAAPAILPLLQNQILQQPALEALGELGDVDVVAPLARLLNESGEGAPAMAVVESLVAIHDRYERQYGEGDHVAELAGRNISGAGAQRVIDALANATEERTLRALVIVLGWLEGQEAEIALAQQLSRRATRKEVSAALVRHGQRTTRLLIEQLAAPDVEVREAAVMILGQVGDPAAVPALVDLLVQDDELTITTAGALAKIGDRRASNALLDLLGHPSAAVRQAVISAINSLGHPDMARQTIALIQDPDPRVRESAVKIAGYFGYPECADLLLAAATTDDDENVRRAAVEHLPYVEDGRVVATIRRALQHESPAVRAAAAHAYGALEDEEAGTYLLQALQDEDAWVRYFALRSIGRLELAGALEIVAQLVEDDPAGQVRSAAIETVGRIDGERSVAILEPLANSADSDKAAIALRALGSVHHPSALPPLLAALRHPDRARAIEAIRALGEHGGEGVAAALQWTVARAPLTGDELGLQGREAIDALVRLGNSEAIQVLVELTVDALRRPFIVPALVAAGERDIEEVIRGLSHPQPAVRRAVIQALASMKRERASDALVGALDDQEPAVRVEAVTALIELGSGRAERKLVQMAQNDPEVAVRRAARKALVS
jgi:HEAT repeat protein